MTLVKTVATAQNAWLDGPAYAGVAKRLVGERPFDALYRRNKF